MGSVVTDRSGITVSFFGYSNSLDWDEITEVRFKEKTKAIVLRAGQKKLAIDSRFVAREHLLNEIEAHTRSRQSGT